MKETRSRTNTRILLVTDRLNCADHLGNHPDATRFELVAVLASAAGLLFQLQQHPADVILVDLPPATGVLENLAAVNRHRPTAIALAVHDGDPATMHQFITAGICTFLPGKLDPARIALAADLALAQFGAMQALRTQLTATRTELEERIHIDKAKKLLMQQKRISEDTAHQMLLRLAMNHKQRLPTIARTVINTLSDRPADRRPIER